jgi:nitrite reductase (NADH) small subunit
VTSAGAKATTEGHAVIRLDHLVPGRGVAALVEGRAIAVFLVQGELHAIDNIDPHSGASVMSRGIVGDADGVATIASPMYKHRFDLTSGRGLDGDAAIAVHDATCVDGIVHVRLAAVT